MKSATQAGKCTRRQLVLGLARAAGMALLGAAALRATRRAAVASAPRRGNDSCRFAGSCRDCRILARCGHPRGIGARQVLGEQPS
jgi:hypothetical protein